MLRLNASFLLVLSSTLLWSSTNAFSAVAPSAETAYAGAPENWVQIKQRIYQTTPQSPQEDLELTRKIALDHIYGTEDLEMTMELVTELVRQQTYQNDDDEQEEEA